MSTTFKSYKDLEVWQKSMKFVKRLYQTTQTFPSEERFGLTNQLRRAAVSVPSNLAARFGPGEFTRFISIAMGSVAEIETQILLSADLGYVTAKTSTELLSELETIGKMLRGLAKAITKRRNA